MLEEEFRRRLRGALGEPPHLASPVLQRSAAAAPRIYPRLMGVLAAGVAILLIIVLVGSRIALQPRGYVVPARSAPPSAGAQLPPDSMPCHLAVNLMQWAANQGGSDAVSSTAGFVNIPAGTFGADPAVSGPNEAGAITYSDVLKRWLPAQPRMISPDGRSYAYSKLLPAGANLTDATSSELHVVNAVTRADREVWSQNAAIIEVISWSSSGILVSTLPPQGGILLLWYVNPSTGAASKAPNDADPTRIPSGMLQNRGNYSYLGSDGAGGGVYRFGSRDQGTKYSVEILKSGQFTTIYAGTQGDATDFDPEGMSSDAHGLWFGNYDGARVWLWTQAAGLRTFRVVGAPPPPAGYQYTSASFLPAGPCVPGQFSGVAALPLPAPSPTPAPPVVDWAPFLTKPLKLPTVAPGTACPVSAQVNLGGKVKQGKGVPGYGYGSGPVYLSGQLTWYSGSQGLVVVTDPSYAGPVLIRAKRLDGIGAANIAAVNSPGQSLADGAIGIPETSSPPYWGVWFGAIAPSAPGCYGIQFDGTSVSDYVVIQVKPGPPPPG